MPPKDDRPLRPVCGRDPRRVNDMLHECSHVDCPTRRRCWSDGTPHHHQQAREVDPDIARLFDNPDKF